jgi:hypothetical protein
MTNISLVGLRVRENTYGEAREGVVEAQADTSTGRNATILTVRHDDGTASTMLPDCVVVLDMDAWRNRGAKATPGEIPPTLTASLAALEFEIRLLCSLAAPLGPA